MAFPSAGIPANAMPSNTRILNDKSKPAVATIPVWLGRGWVLNAKGEARPDIGGVPDVDAENQFMAHVDIVMPNGKVRKQVRADQFELDNVHGTVEEAEEAAKEGIPLDVLERLMKPRHSSLRIDLGGHVDPITKDAKIEADRVMCLAKNGYGPDGKRLAKGTK